MIAALHTGRPDSGQALEQFSRQQEPWLNVGDLERWLSVVGGGALAALGLARGSLGGLALGLVGGAIMYRGLTGHCSVYSALGVNTAQASRGSSTGEAAEPGAPAWNTGPNPTRQRGIPD